MKRFSILFSFIIFILTLLYQNCSQVLFQYAPFVAPGAANNANGYSGKSDEHFYRMLPDFTCEEKAAPVASIDVVNTTITLTENKKLKCAVSSETLQPTLVDASIYQNDVVGYQEGIFESMTSSPQSIPANLVEVWCKDRADDQGIETLTHFDHVSNLAVNRIYYSKAGAVQTISDFSVARSISSNTVFLRALNGFELTVHRDQPSSQLGLFNADLRAVIDGQSKTLQTYCRLGGSLDPKVWPSKEIVDMNVIDVKFSPDQNHFAYTSDLETSVANLYSADANGENQMRSAPLMTDSGVKSFEFSLDSNSLIYSGDSRTDGFVELFKVNRDGSSRAQLSNTLTNAYEGVTADFKLAADGRSIVFRDGLNQPIGSQQKWLWSTPLSGGIPQLISPAFPIHFDTGVRAFAVSRSQNKVIFLAGFYLLNLYSVNIDGSNLQTITPAGVTAQDGTSLDDLLKPFPTGVTGFLSLYDFKLTSDDKYALIQATDPSGAQRYFAVATDGSSAVEAPSGWVYETSDPSGQYGLFSDFFSGTQETAILNFRSGVLKPLTSFAPAFSISQGTNYDPTFTDAIFSTDSQYLMGSLASADGKRMPSLVSLASGQLLKICGDLNADSVSVSELSSQQFLIATFDQDEQTLALYSANLGGGCKQINSAVATVSTNNYINRVSISPDRHKVLVTIGQVDFNPSMTTYTTAKNQQQLFYLPLDGSPSLIVNAPVTTQALITDAHFLGDSRSVFYVGDQILPDEQNIFLWTAP